MSNEAITWAWRAPVKLHSDLLVLVALADHANEQSGMCWPGHELLALKARVDVRSVKRSIKRLAAAGLVQIRRHPGRANQYRLCLEREFPKLKTRLKDALKTTHKGGDSMSPDPGLQESRVGVLRTLNNRESTIGGGGGGWAGSPVDAGDR